MNDQLNLFENEDFTLGINYLNELKWEEGLKSLRRADPYHKEDKICLKKAIKTAVYWEETLQCFQQHKKDQHTLKEVLGKYRKFKFVNRLSAAKRRIRKLLVEEWIGKGSLDYDTTIMFFTFLMEDADYSSSERLMLAYLEQDPKQPKVYYLLGQAEWLNGHKGRAKKHYLQAFLLYPDRTMMNYVESPELKALAERHPVYMIPAYAWLEGKAPFVKIKERISFVDRRQEDSYLAYELLEKCHHALKARNNPLLYRKKLKKVSPELFDAYLRKT